MKIENPDAWPAYVYIEPMDGIFDAIRKRGADYFDFLAEAGFNVTRLSAENEDRKLTIRPPWTLVYLPLERTTPDTISAFSKGLCSVIVDVHFPVVHQETVLTENDDALLDLLERREEMLETLRRACAVTVSQEEWAADIAEFNSNVWYLPDIKDDEESIITFTYKFSDMVRATIAICRGQGQSEDPASR